MATTCEGCCAEHDHEETVCVVLEPLTLDSYNKYLDELMKISDGSFFLAPCKKREDFLNRMKVCICPGDGQSNKKFTPFLSTVNALEQISIPRKFAFRKVFADVDILWSIKKTLLEYLNKRGAVPCFCGYHKNAKILDHKLLAHMSKSLGIPIGDLEELFSGLLTDPTCKRDEKVRIKCNLATGGKNNLRHMTRRLLRNLFSYQPTGTWVKLSEFAKYDLHAGLTKEQKMMILGHPSFFV